MAVQKFSSKLQALRFFFAVVAASATLSAVEGIEKFDANMAVQSGAQADGLKWIDGRDLPLEGRAFADTATAAFPKVDGSAVNTFFKAKIEER